MMAIHITGGTLIDGSGSASQPGIDVVTDGDAIIAVGPSAEVSAAVPDGATVIDATGLHRDARV